MNTIEATYENGVFRPVQPVELPENQRVTVILPLEANGSRADPAGPRSLKDLVGSVPIPNRALSDEDCDRLRDEALREKFGP